MGTAGISMVFVDDEMILASLLKDFVESEFPAWTIASFCDEVKALDHIRDHADAIDVVVCDIGMPYISGIEILEIVARNHPRIRRVVLSGMIDARSLLGSSRFAELSLCKPIKCRDLCQKVGELVATPR